MDNTVVPIRQTTEQTREYLRRFVETLFRYADDDTWVALRVFRDDGEEDAILARSYRLDDQNLSAEIEKAVIFAAEYPTPAVFCPPISTFSKSGSAKNVDLANGLALSVECDSNPEASYKRLRGILGEPTVIVESGGVWADPDSEWPEYKVHLHWRLTEPTRSPQDHAKLQLARSMACDIVGGDGTSKNPVHPMRWPGSWHRKKAPRMAKISGSTDNEIELSDALERLSEAHKHVFKDRPVPTVDRKPIGGAIIQGLGIANPLKAQHLSDVASALEVIPNRDLPWDDWNKILMATWAATDGCAEGLAVAQEWSAKSDKHDQAKTAARWAHYSTSPPTKIGAGTLFYLAHLEAPDWTKPSAADARQQNNNPQQEQPPAKFRVIAPEKLHGVAVPQRHWMIDQWMPWLQTTALYGDGGVGKSLLAQQAMTAVSTGLPFLGLDVLQCPSFGLFCEDDDDELHRRQADINASMGVEWTDLSAMRWTSRVGEENILMSFDRDGAIGALTPIWSELEDTSKRLGSRLVVIDTAADTYGGNENIRPQVRQFIQKACTKLARTIDGCVLLCAHPSLSGMASGSGSGGSTAWSNSVRSRWYVRYPEPEDDEEPGATDYRLLTKKKANYGRSGDEIKIMWEGGCFRRVGATMRDTVDSIAANVQERKDDEAFLMVVQRLRTQGRPLSHAPNAKNYAPKEMAKEAEFKGRSRKDIAATMQRLFDAERLLANANSVRAGSRWTPGLVPVRWSNGGTNSSESDENAV